MKKLLFISALILSLNFSVDTAAYPSGDCSGTPGDAVLELPAPFSQWGQIVCNGINHSISGRGDWFWKGDSNYSQVEVNSSGQYFKDIQARQLKGAEIKEYVSILEGKESNSKPKTYVLELTADNDSKSKVIFFEYGLNSIWAMKCTSSCDANSKFMVMNKVGQ